MSTTPITRLTVAAALTVAGFAVAGPAVAASGAHPTKAQVEHAEATGAAGAHPTKAQVEHDEATTANRTYESDIVADAVRQTQGTAPRAPHTQPQPMRQPDPSFPTSTLLVVLGGTAVVGAAGFTAYRFQHHGGVGPTTA